jgi:hypothetical protein
MATPTPETRDPAGGVTSPTTRARDDCRHVGGPGLRHVSRRPAGWNRRRRSPVEALGGGPAGPALVRWRERPVRAALKTYRNFERHKLSGFS